MLAIQPIEQSKVFYSEPALGQKIMETSSWVTGERRIQGRSAKIIRLLSCVMLLLLPAAIPAFLHAQTFQALPALSFTKVYAGGNPPPQVMTAASTGSSFLFSTAVVNISGGNWLTISPDNVNLGTPRTITVSVHPDGALAPGDYSAQITLTSQANRQVTVIPVALAVLPVNAPSFDATSGALTFSFVRQGSAPPVQTVPIRNAGTGTLNWTAAASTADGGNWVSLSARSGTAPSSLQVGVIPANLPNGGLSAGTFVGQVVLQTDGDRITIPVTVAIGGSVFRQISSLFFTQAYQMGTPPPQVITAVSTGSSFLFSTAAVSSTGGDWLTISPNNVNLATPRTITVSVNPASPLNPGTYTAEIILSDQDGTQASVIPVTYTVAPPDAAFFDQTAGELTFSLVTRGDTPPLQPIPIRNAGAGTLNWTASASTADGGNWLTLSAASGSAPSSLQVGVTTANLPNGGLSAGTFIGQVVLQTGSDRTTIPVTVTVGDSVFRQLNDLSFTKAYQGGNPPPQVITAASTGASFLFSTAAVSSTGGNWLSISPNNVNLETPRTITVSANPDNSLNPGTYNAEIILSDQDGTQASVIPVTLTVAPPTAAFFDQTPGELTFSFVRQGNAPPLQPIPIRNAGTGTLNWTASASTADGGNWLALSAASGTAPSSLQVGIIPANLPNGGLSAGTFIGQVVLQTGSDRTTVPVTVTVGDSVFRQINSLSFTQAFQMGNPPPQVITVASTGASFLFSTAAVSSTGGNWLTISPNNVNLGTPRSITVFVNPATPLNPGTYTSEIILSDQDGTQASVIPVTLTVAPPTAAFFDQTAGALTFFAQPGSGAPPGKAVPIRNAGTGTLNWTASTSTADGGDWLTLSASSGTAPSTLVVGVNPSALPGAGLSAGTFIGQVVLQTNGDSVTVPVTVTVGASTFTSLGALNFSKPYQGANPPSQVLSAASTGASFLFATTAVTSTGGNWLLISPNNVNLATPQPITVSVNAESSLSPGNYTAEIILNDQDGTQASVIPVFLTVGSTAPPTATPTFTPGTGSYTATQSVTLADPTPGATIYYTTNGTTPSTSSSQYTGPISVSANETLEAVAVATGATLSSVATATYTFVPAVVTPASLSFGSQGTGTSSAPRTLTFSNPGTNALAGLTFSLFGANAGDFNFSSSGCDAVTAGGTCAVAITFSPTATGTRSATLNISDNGIGSPFSVALSGTGAATSTSITLTPTPSSVTYGQSLSVAASLSGNPTPTGTLSYQVDSAANQTATLSTGAANLSLGILSAGSHLLTVTYLGDATHASTSQTLSFSIGKAVLTATPISVSRAYGQSNPALTYTVTSLLNGDTASAVSGSATLTTTATLTSPVGVYPITFATNSLTAANYTFTALPGTLTITQAAQSITFPPISNQTYGAALTLAATASSGLQVSYTVSGPATLAGSLLTITGTGSISLTASQAGDANHSAAAPVTQTFTAGLASQTITFTGLPASAVYGSAGPYTLGGRSSSGLPVSYSVSGPASLSGTVLTITGAGTVSVTASQAGNTTYGTAAPVTLTIVVSPASQTLIFNGLPSTAVYGEAGPYALNAVASSSLPVSYSVSGPATLSGAILTITAPGTVAVTASQAGSANYTAALPITQTILVSPATIDGTVELVTTGTLTRQPDGSYQATVLVFNVGTGSAQNVVLTGMSIGAATGSPLPRTLGVLQPGANAVITLAVPSTAGPSGSKVIERISGTYTGGTFGGSLRATLP